MKNSSFYTILCLSFVLMAITSCSDTAETPPADTTVDITPIITAAKQGTWRVTKYSDHGGDETDHFTGYIFTFGDNDVLTVTNGTNTHTGIWLVSKTPIAPYQSVPDESPNDPVDFNIYFAPNEPINFTDINDDWDRVTMTDTKMEFIDVSAEVGKKADKITFEKN